MPITAPATTTTTTSFSADLDDSDDLFECDLCCELFETSGSRLPLNLQCGHTFCSGCLNKSKNNQIVCRPACRIDTLLPNNGISGLPTCWRLVRIIESKKKKSTMEWADPETKNFFITHKFPKDIQQEFRTYTMHDLERAKKEDLT